MNPSLAAALAIALWMLALWGVSVRLRDASVVDPAWGPGFVLVAWLALALAEAPGARGVLLALLTTAWGLRLGAHLLHRWRGHGEDRRYRRMRAAHGARFPLVSLFTVFGLQGVLLWVVALPLHAAIHRAGTRPLGWLDLAGAAIFALGLAFEASADAQLSRFSADERNRGRVLRTGLWRWTRHPNYFGDACVWWGLGLVAAAGGAAWTLLGPAVMTALLLRVSGVTLLERDIAERRPAYRDYVATTSAFFPWPPRRAG